MIMPKLSLIAILIALLLASITPPRAANAPVATKKAEPAAPQQPAPKRWADDPLLPEFSAIKAAECRARVGPRARIFFRQIGLAGGEFT
jgi:hypothetical protein